MLKHHLILFFRNIKKNKSTFLINLIGLATGLTCVLLTTLWVLDELSVDRFHEKKDRLYQVLQHSNKPNAPTTGTYTAGLTAETLIREMPEIEYAVASRIREEEKTLSHDDKHIKATVQFASEDFFNAFSYKLIEGNKDQVLRDPNSMVISKKLAINLFNSTDNIIGKVVEFDHQNEYRVSGIFEEPPSNSSLQFDFILSFEEYKKFDPNVLNWTYNTAQTYLVLTKGTDINEFNKKITHFLDNKTEDSFNKYITLSTRNYSNAYLYSRYENGKQVGGRIEHVRLFSMIAIIILLIACINFIYLSTANASSRIKETGIKKAIGVSKRTLVMQYLTESVCMALLAMLLSVIFVWILLPQFNHLTGKRLDLSLDGEFILVGISMAILTGIAAGSYPAWFISGFRPARVLKGTLDNTESGTWIRKGLVVGQFVLSVVFIVSVLVVYKQIKYVQAKNLGYDKDNVAFFEIEGEFEENLDTYLSEVRDMPGIINASSMGQSIVGGSQNTFIIDDWEGKDPDTRIVFETRPVNYGMIEMLGIEMAQGRTFSKDYGKEDSKIIFNEAAVKTMGLKDPIGKTITIQGTRLEIIGITEDFHFASLHESINPLFFVLRPSWTHKLMVKIAAGKEYEVIGQLQQFYEKNNPGFPFEYSFLDQEYQAQYNAESKISVLARYFAGLAILISCLGLLGLAAHTAQQRNKEIGIRKVLGASVSSVVTLLSKDFIRLVLIAIVIATPIAWYAMNQWLQGFAYKIELQWWMFAGAGLVAVVIAMVTVAGQSVKAAMANPIDSVKSE